MKFNSLKKSFLSFCADNNLEKNDKQIEIIDLLTKFNKSKQSIFKFFFKADSKLCFYLYGDVGLGKTMILDHYYDYITISKQRFHFNEFMIFFHNFRHNNKKNSIKEFVKKIKKYKLIYLDEFQVTNIVDAMILGKLFESIFLEKIKILISSNIKIDNLYKDGLQREQFLPFISLIKKYAIQKELIINEDYRKLGSEKLQRLFFPLNEKTLFKINYLFRKLTKNKIKKSITLKIKGRDFQISNFYEGIAKFDFKNLCDVNIGAEDYLKISEKCKIIFIENIPDFNNENINQQQRFITLIDILYEKNVSLVVSIEKNIKDIGSSTKLVDPFRRTTSRLFELTSPV